MALNEYREAVNQITGRVVEIPYLIRHLKKGNILDVGSEASVYIPYLLDKNRKIVRIDVRPITKFKDEEIIIQDIRNFNRPNAFDNILLIGSLEHFALKCDPYGTDKDWKMSPFQEQKEILKHCFEMLKEKGKMIVTLPYGKYFDGRWYIYYDKSMIDNLKEEFKIIDIEYYTCKYGLYFPCNEEEVDMTEGMLTSNTNYERDRNIICFTILK